MFTGTTYAPGLTGALLEGFYFQFYNRSLFSGMHLIAIHSKHLKSRLNIKKWSTEISNPMYPFLKAGFNDSIKPGGLFHCYMLEESICQLRGVGSILSLSFYF